MYILLFKQPRKMLKKQLVKMNDLEFIGFVTLYTKTNVLSVQAFNILSFALFKYLDTTKLTIIHCLITSNEMVGSTMSERISQIIQLVQLRQHKRACVKFAIRSE